MKGHDPVRAVGGLQGISARRGTAGPGTQGGGQGAVAWIPFNARAPAPPPPQLHPGEQVSKCTQGAMLLHQLKPAPPHRIPGNALVSPPPLWSPPMDPPLSVTESSFFPASAAIAHYDLLAKRKLSSGHGGRAGWPPALRGTLPLPLPPPPPLPLLRARRRRKGPRRSRGGRARGAPAAAEALEGGAARLHPGAGPSEGIRQGIRPGGGG